MSCKAAYSINKKGCLKIPKTTESLVVCLQSAKDFYLAMNLNLFISNAYKAFKLKTIFLYLSCALYSISISLAFYY